jgi:hypothetical protein
MPAKSRLVSGEVFMLVFLFGVFLFGVFLFEVFLFEVFLFEVFLFSDDEFMFVINLSYEYEVGVLPPPPATVRTCNKRMTTVRQKLSFGLECPQRRQAVPGSPKQTPNNIVWGKLNI